MFRYDPRNKENPLTVDSSDPTIDYKEFVKGENRYARLIKADPEAANKIFDEAKIQAAQRLEMIKSMGKAK